MWRRLREVESIVSLVDYVLKWWSWNAAIMSTFLAWYQELPLWAGMVVAIGGGVAFGLIVEAGKALWHRKRRSNKAKRDTEGFDGSYVLRKTQDWLLNQGYSIKREPADERDHCEIVVVSRKKEGVFDPGVYIFVPKVPSDMPLRFFLKVILDDTLSKNLARLSADRQNQLMCDIRIAVSNMGVELQSTNPFEMCLWEEIEEESFSEMWLVRHLEKINRAWEVSHMYLLKELGVNVS